MGDEAEVVDTFVSILKIPLPSEAYIREDENFFNINTKWSTLDAATKSYIGFAKTFTVLKGSLGTDNPVISASGSTIVTEGIVIPSNSGEQRFLIANQAGVQFLQIWNAETLEKSYNLAEVNLHGMVYPSAAFGTTTAWSPNDSKIAYIAEKKQIPSTFQPPNDDSKKRSKPAEYRHRDEYGFKQGWNLNDKEKDEYRLTDEFAFRQTWGEMLDPFYESVIIIFDLISEEFHLIQPPENAFPTDIQWVGETHLIGTSYPIPAWRLGFGYRLESRLFSVRIDGENFQFITEPKQISRSPRVRPDGNFLVYQTRLLDGPGERARTIMGVELSNGIPSSQPYQIYSSSPSNNYPIWNDFSRNCFTTDGSRLLIATPNDTIMTLLMIVIANPNQIAIVDRVDAILSITNDYLLVSSSSMMTGRYLRLVNISTLQSIPITTAATPIDFDYERKLISGEFSPPSVYYGPTNVPEKSVPLIVYPHGGPHASSIDYFYQELACFLKLGFGIFYINFVGSTGGVRDTADELIGRIGDRDVKDCQNQVEQLLLQTLSLDPSKVVFYGGSHGGFLGAHLSSQYPDSYKAVVLLNPMVDTSTFVGVTDIADWAYVETGLDYEGYPIEHLLPSARNLDDAKKYLDSSPIHHAEKVNAPTLLLLGSLDQRVPCQNGINYFRALISYGKIAEIRLYPDHHSLQTAPARLDSGIRAVLWFKKYLG